MRARPRPYDRLERLCRSIARPPLAQERLEEHGDLGRELQMATGEPCVKRAPPSRAALFDFSTLGTLRDLVLRRAGSLTRPGNRLTLTIAATGPARQTIEHFMQQLQSAA